MGREMGRLAAGADPAAVRVRDRARRAWPPADSEAFVKMADFGTLPPELPLDCGSVYVGQMSTIVTQAISAILRGQAVVCEGVAFGAG